VWTRPPLPTVWADVSLLKQVFINLVPNALNYTRPRNPAEIEVRTAEPSESQWTVLVRDNGVGFDSNQTGKLFGSFPRLHNKNAFEGTGVGLATV
jgi:two-component system, chemotaxis family, sensor kinase Cph1